MCARLKWSLRVHVKLIFRIVSYHIVSISLHVKLSLSYCVLSWTHKRHPFAT